MWGSCGDRGDQAVDVLNCIVEVGRNANFGFAEADENFLFAELVIELGGFFWSARDEAAVRAAEFSVERTCGDAAVDRQTGKHEVDELVIVRENSFRFCAQNEFDGGVERGEVEIEVAGPFRSVPALGACGGGGGWGKRVLGILWGLPPPPQKRSGGGGR